METEPQTVKICFICRSTKSAMYFKFKDYLKKYKFCVNPEIQNNNYELCCKCVSNLQRFNEFKWQCLDSEEFWLKLAQTPSEPVSNKMVQDMKCELKIDDDLILKIKYDTNKEDKSKINLTSDVEQIDHENDQSYHENDKNCHENNQVDEKYLMQMKQEPREVDFDDYDIDNTDNTNEIDYEDNDQDYLPNNKKQKTCQETILQKKEKKNKLFASCHKCKAVLTLKILRKHVETCGQLDNEKESPSNVKLKLKEAEEALYCGLCDVTNKDVTEMKQHLKTHYEENCLKCQLCSFEGKDFGHMLYHRYIHQPQDKKFCYSCCLCDFIWMGPRSKLKLEYHFRETHLQKKPGICYHCDKVYNKYNTHKIHLDLLETGGQECPICSWRFPSKGTLNSHMKSTHGEKVFLCSVCGASFNKKHNMQSHMATHEAINPVKCSHCNKTFKSPRRLELHMMLVKKGPYFTCDLCSKGYNSRRDLKVHLAYHSDSRPFQCQMCDKAFKTKFNADEHMRCVHIKQLRFKCDQCGMAFPRAEQLKRHQVSHTGVRLHPCIYCAKDFNDKGRLNRHVIHKHSSLSSVI